MHSASEGSPPYTGERKYNFKGKLCYSFNCTAQKFYSIGPCLWQPSPVAEMAMRAACLYFQSPCCNICGVIVRMNGKTVLPPRPQAILEK